MAHDHRMRKLVEPYLNRYNAMRQLDHGVVHSAKKAMDKDSVVVNMYANQYKKLNSKEAE